MQNYAHIPQLGATIARIRDEAKLNQSSVAKKAEIEQSRLSRIEQGIITTEEDFDAVVDALIALKANNAKELRAYMNSDWEHIEETPSFWNPERECLGRVEDTLKNITTFLETNPPWPLEKQIKRQKESLERDSLFLNRLDHNIAFIGDIGIGKSTAISFIFDLLMPASKSKSILDRPILETGAGGTTICEVRIKSGDGYGLTLSPMPDRDIRYSISDFCAAEWHKDKAGESVSVSLEMERAFRNMSGLTRTREKEGEKIIRKDPIDKIRATCETEDEFRMKITELMNLEQRTRYNLWHYDSPEKNPMAWMQDTFKKVNNGRIPDVPLPSSIELIVPDLEQTFGEFQITVIDTKGIEESATRRDIDSRLKDPHTMAIFCSGFKDLPNISTQELLQHMKERLTEGKVAILALPHVGEALAMKDDTGDLASTDEEGYDLKSEQVSTQLAARGFNNVPIFFYNASTDEAKNIRNSLFEQLKQMRKSVESKLDNLCETSQHIITNSAEQAMLTAIEEVNKRLSHFIKVNLKLDDSEKQLPHVFALEKIRKTRYASVLWATTRRQGKYSDLDIPHFVKMGAIRDADNRIEKCFNGLEMELNSLKNDEGLALAKGVIAQRGEEAKILRDNFLEAIGKKANSIYEEPLSKASVWGECEDEWGAGPGFTRRVASHIEDWFEDKSELADNLEESVKQLWEEEVIMPLQSQVEENESETYNEEE